MIKQLTYRYKKRTTYEVTHAGIYLYNDDVLVQQHRAQTDFTRGEYDNNSRRVYIYIYDVITGRIQSQILLKRSKPSEK